MDRVVYGRDVTPPIYLLFVKIKGGKCENEEYVRMRQTGMDVYKVRTWPWRDGWRPTYLYMLRSLLA